MAYLSHWWSLSTESRTPIGHPYTAIRAYGIDREAGNVGFQERREEGALLCDVRGTEIHTEWLCGIKSFGECQKAFFSVFSYKKPNLCYLHKRVN